MQPQATKVPDAPTAPVSPSARPRACSRPPPAPLGAVAAPDVVQETAAGPVRGRTLLFSLSVFAGAFLLFQVQPVIGKSILPWFGSSPGVWATCMLFFQVLLVAGYAYAHFVVSRLSGRGQALLHGSLLAAAILTLPVLPDAGWKPTTSDSPTLQILMILGATVGLPYLLLSSTGPLLQGWYVRLHPGRSPYRLYALSNAGSLLALLTYPFLIEPWVRLADQGRFWSLGYVAFVVLGVLCCRLLLRGAPGPVPQRVRTQQGDGRPGLRAVASWLLLSATGSGLLLATTNQMCLDVAVVPFLWVVPLALYLITFILCFDSDRWYARPLFAALLPLALLWVVRLLHLGIRAGLVEQVAGYSFTLFVSCMVCHGELARQRPAPRHLTFFFLMISIGGAFGGAFVAIGAPALFSGPYEFPLLLTLCAALVAATYLRLPPAPREGGARRLLRRVGWGLSLAGMLLGILFALRASTWVGADDSLQRRQLYENGRQILLLVVASGACLALLHAEIHRRAHRLPATSFWLPPRRLARMGLSAAIVSAVLILAGTFVFVAQAAELRNHVQDRGFFGMLALRSYDEGRPSERVGLKHGRIRHGVQYRQHPGWPTSYYGPRSGVGLAIRLHPSRHESARSFRVGVIGLGAGTLAAYAHARVDPDRSRAHYVRPERPVQAEHFRFYELSPMVEAWAEEHFRFLRDARARGAVVDTCLGDARLVLERQLRHGDPQGFDVLAVDAFSGDAIPIHLLTLEALRTYWQHLRPDGILALHVSNRFLDLRPIVRRLALDLGRELVYVKNEDRESRGIDGASWLLMTNNEAFLALRAVQEAARDLPPPGPRWSDEQGSLFDLILKRR